MFDFCFVKLSKVSPVIYFSLKKTLFEPILKIRIHLFYSQMNIDPEDLIPKLPKPRDLMPFPVVQSLKYEGHEGFVRSISVCPTGQWLASGKF